MAHAFCVDYLANHAEFIPLLAGWHHAQWPLESEPSLEHRIEIIQDRLGRREIPTTLVALQDKSALGFVSLIANNMECHTELSPWLASLYVHPAFRQQGIGTALTEAILREAHALAIRCIYLFTPDQESFYERLGWRIISRKNYHGENVAIMACTPHANPS
jgi:N-acetylglutamate synthase-like GNAT family acetyltransferase